MLYEVITEARYKRVLLKLSGEERGIAYREEALDELDPSAQANEIALATARMGRYHHYRLRITSYNVCYTKLLRKHAARVLSPVLVAHPGAPVLRPPLGSCLHSGVRAQAVEHR